ncbi:hypothetical protein FHW94_002136 [Novosphingobium sp. SG720]|nr:hypothetical protein [Novosphingobium sp. SG720]
MCSANRRSRPVCGAAMLQHNATGPLFFRGGGWGWCRALRQGAATSAARTALVLDYQRLRSPGALSKGPRVTAAAKLRRSGSARRTE